MGKAVTGLGRVFMVRVWWQVVSRSREGVSGAGLVAGMWARGVFFFYMGLVAGGVTGLGGCFWCRSGGRNVG